MRDPEAFGAFVRRVAPEHAHLIFAEIQREADAGQGRAVANAHPTVRGGGDWGFGDAA